MTVEQRLEQLEKRNKAPDGGVDDDGRDDLRGGDDGGDGREG
jgi:hypothetical protein